MATALLDQDVQPEREDLARSARNKTTTSPSYDNWKKPNGWRVYDSTLTDLIGKQKDPTTDRLDFTGTGEAGSASKLKVTRTDPDTLKTTVIPDWGTKVVFDSATDSVTLDHVKPASAGGGTVTLTITRDTSGSSQTLSSVVIDNWFTKSSRRRRGHGHGAIDIGSWTAVEG